MTKPEYTSAGSNDRLLNWLKDAYSRDGIDLLDLELGTAALIADEPLPAHLLKLYVDEGSARWWEAARYNDAPGQVFAYNPVEGKPIWNRAGEIHRLAPDARQDR